MVFKRILHPVGQGAFFTEQFLDESGKVVYNVVYDCGSFTSQPNLLEYEIRNTFERNAHIDLIFISHFDEDHVNGLMTLQNQTKIDKDTKVIIPFKYPYLLMVMDDDYPTLARFVMRMFNIGAQVIGVDDGINENRHGEPIDIDRLDENITLGRKNVIRLDKVLWYYYPFMLPDQSSLQKVFEGMVKGIVNLDDPNEILTKRKELRDIYKTIGKTKGGVTRINVNALFMLSFPAVDLTYNTNIWHQINLIGGAEPTCFYTGDSNLKGNGYDEVKQRVTDILDSYSKGTKVSMMQVPHHGSDKCFPEKMADRTDGFFKCGFVNCNPWHRQKVFDSGIIGEFTRNNKMLLLVTECYHSRVEVIAELFKIKRNNDVDECFFSNPAVVELPIDNDGYKCDANYHVRVMVDAKDIRLIVRLNRRLSWLIEHEFQADFDDRNEYGNLFSIKETKKLCTILTLKRFVGGVLSLIDIAVNNSATLFIRIDEGKVLDASENEERKPLFANVASKDVRINTKLLMGVLKEMGAHLQLSVCIKLEG